MGTLSANLFLRKATRVANLSLAPQTTNRFSSVDGVTELTSLSDDAVADSFSFTDTSTGLRRPALLHADQ